jgi:hypothetical protein
MNCELQRSILGEQDRLCTFILNTITKNNFSSLKLFVRLVYAHSIVNDDIARTVLTAINIAEDIFNRME